MVMPPIHIDRGDTQFDNLQALYNKAIESLLELSENHPEYSFVWKNVRFRMNEIQQTLHHRTLPSRKIKEATELGTMLRYECPDMAETGELVSLYKLDNAYQLLGIKPLSEQELEVFSEKMGCKINH